LALFNQFIYSLLLLFINQQSVKFEKLTTVVKNLQRPPANVRSYSCIQMWTSFVNNENETAY